MLHLACSVGHFWATLLPCPCIGHGCTPPVASERKQQITCQYDVIERMQPLKGAKFFLKFHVLSRSVSPVMTSEPACVECCLLRGPAPKRCKKRMCFLVNRPPAAGEKISGLIVIVKPHRAPSELRSRPPAHAPAR